MSATGPSHRRAPFKGLASFEDSPLDAMLFFGREREREIITANLLAARLTVLYGPSGVGKSSLLRAGVGVPAAEPRPRERGVGEGARARRRRLQLLERRCACRAEEGGRVRALRRAGSGREANGSLADDLAAWTEELGIDLCLILDQAEEYFVYHGTHGDDGSFVRQFPESAADRGARQLPRRVARGSRSRRSTSSGPRSRTCWQTGFGWSTWTTRPAGRRSSSPCGSTTSLPARRARWRSSRRSSRQCSGRSRPERSATVKQGMAAPPKLPRARRSRLRISSS